MHIAYYAPDAPGLKIATKPEGGSWTNDFIDFSATVGCTPPSPPGTGSRWPTSISPTPRSSTRRR